MASIELSSRAVTDLEDLGRDRRRVEDLLAALAKEPQPANLDIKALQGRKPWSRARTGPYRVIFRALTAEERAELGASDRAGYLVARIVHRRDLERIVRGL